jgi:bacterioferritin (cytochrome b1)
MRVDCNLRRSRALTFSMKKASEYREHARECRGLAANMDSDEQRALMLQMAEHWEKLAADRLVLIEKHPELAHAGEHEESKTWKASSAAPAA